MPWVRLDENAMEHPKIVTLPDGAFRLWVQGLAHCQKFLTDGLITGIAIRALRAYSPKRMADLVAAGLWDQATDGVTVHDYLQWNDSREHVEHGRRTAKERMAKIRGGSRDVRANNARTSGEVRDTTSPPSLHPIHPIRSKEQNDVPAVADYRSKRPIFKGQRLVVFEWMLDDIYRLLGKTAADALDCHEWFYALDARVATESIQVPQRDGGQWLQAVTLEEAKRRGLISEPEHKSKLTKALEAASNGW